MTKVGFMAPDGRCKTFDACADGFGRGEGCGIVALKRLATRSWMAIVFCAVIRGSAVNQDGRSTVLTAPNGKAQKAIIREALERRLSPGTDLVRRGARHRHRARRSHRGARQLRKRPWT